MDLCCKTWFSVWHAAEKEAEPCFRDTWVLILAFHRPLIYPSHPDTRSYLAVSQLDSLTRGSKIFTNLRRICLNGKTNSPGEKIGIWYGLSFSGLCRWCQLRVPALGSQGTKANWLLVWPICSYRFTSWLPARSSPWFILSAIQSSLMMLPSYQTIVLFLFIIRNFLELRSIFWRCYCIWRCWKYQGLVRPKCCFWRFYQITWFKLFIYLFKKQRYE